MYRFPIIYIVVLLFAVSNILITAQSNFEKAVKLLEEKKFEDASYIFEEIVDEDETNAEAYFYLGKIYIQLKDYSEASDYLEDAIDIDGNNAEYHFWLGQAYAGDAQNSSFISAAFIAPKIKDEFAKAVELDPTHIRAYMGLANFHLSAPGIVGGDLEEAFKAGNALVKFDQKRGRLILVNYYLKKELYDSVKVQVALIEEKYKNDLSLASFYNSFGYALIKQEKFEEAIKYFKKQVRLVPENANSYDSLGDGYRAAGNLEEAANQYKKAIELNPEFEISKKNLKEVTELIEDGK